MRTPPEGSFKSISAGNVQTCGIRPDGSMVCWNEKETWDQSGGPYISVGVGQRHYCAVETGGRAVCWGHYAR